MSFFPAGDIISLCVTVGLDAEKIYQPSFINSPEGDKAVLTCRHDITDSRSMYWYIQHPNKAPEALLYGFEKVDPKGRFSMDVNRTERLTNLSISDSRTEDTAVYYCAVQPTPTVTPNVSRGTKTQLQILSKFSDVCCTISIIIYKKANNSNVSRRLRNSVPNKCSLSCGASVGEERFTDFDFVDDAVIFAESMEALIRAPKRLSEGSECLGLRVSWIKTKIQAFIDF
uniref:Ig-like domain-containing protein n=1 Tax=Paramormyrops kingsleyae TaxID=1676925 RepID=A0A3B3Q2F2_9TELE